MQPHKTPPLEQNSAPALVLERQKQLFAYFDTLGISHDTIRHPPFFTVEQGLEWHGKIPGLHCKTLFLKDKKDKLWMAVIPFNMRADLNALEKKIGSARLSFGKSELLWDILGVTPGSVTPFALLFDGDKKVQAVLDRKVAEAEKLCYHPLLNDATTTLSGADFLKFLRATGHEPLIADCGA